MSFMEGEVYKQTRMIKKILSLFKGNSEEIKCYDTVYSHQSNASRKRRIPFYQKLASFISPGDHVIDIGCGNGMLPSLSQWNTYSGVDFSGVAIEQARKICPKASFVCGDALKFLMRQDDYTVVVMTEFLEHVDNDIEILDMIIPEVKVIISVPNEERMVNGKPIGYPTHKRRYTTTSIVERYDMVHFDEVFVFEHWIIAIGRIKCE